MKIACLQFAPQLGDIDNNLNRADAVLNRATNLEDLDLLVLPELAFTGYNFKSLQHINPYLEHTTSGITSLWARTTALKYECVVTVGYPEKVDVSERWPASPEYYNSAIMVNADGETIANYRKTFLYYLDETWALEGPDGFYDGEVPELGNVAMGICMDLNPYKFEAPHTAWEFAYHVLHKQANLVIISMAWMTRQDLSVYSRTSKEPDIDTLSYWVSRLEPIIRAEVEGEIIVVFANRCGTENEAIYAGTSCVLGIHEGEVKVYGILGRGERELLVVDTTKEPLYKLVAEPNSANPKDTAPKAEQAPPESEPLGSPRNTRVDTPYPSDTRVQGREALVASIESVLSLDFPAVSPVESTKAHAFFGAEHPLPEERVGKFRSGTSASEVQSSTTSIILKDPTPPRSGTPRSGNTSATGSHRNRAAERRAERRSKGASDLPSEKPQLRPPKQKIGMIEIPDIDSNIKLNNQSKVLSPKQKLGMIEIPDIDWDIQLKDQPPDSASSMIVNTPWEPNSAVSRVEEIIKIMIAPTPSPPIPASTLTPPSVSLNSRSDNSKEPIPSSVKQASILSILSSSDAPPSASSNKHTPPPDTPTVVIPTQRPQSPKSRNTSRTRPLNKELALETRDLIVKPGIGPVVAPVEETGRVVSGRQGTPNLAGQSLTNGNVVLHNERSMSPRPNSTGW